MARDVGPKCGALRDCAKDCADDVADDLRSSREYAAEAEQDAFGARGERPEWMLSAARGSLRAGGRVLGGGASRMMATYAGADEAVENEAVKIALFTRQDYVVSNAVAQHRDAVADENVDFVIAEGPEDLLNKHGKEDLAKIRGVLLSPMVASAPLGKLLEPGAELANVKWIHSFSAGVDHMADLLAGTLTSTRSDIAVSNGRGAFSSSLAEYVILGCLHFNKKVARCQQNKREKNWDRFTMPVLRGKTIGFVGFGHIAKSAAAIAKDGFGMKVVACRRNPDKSDSALADKVYTDKVEMARDCDFVVCSLPGTPATMHFCDKALFDAMPDGSVFISCGRGAAVDEAALAQHLRDERLFAALDVFEQEPLPETSELWEVPDDRVLLTAHNADLTEDFYELGWETFRKNLARFRAGEDLETPVDKSHGY